VADVDDDALADDRLDLDRVVVDPDYRHLVLNRLRRQQLPQEPADTAVPTPESA
jgi:hypothetical protein